MEILAPAKINIVLRVLGRRVNGYHDLLMLNEKLSVADEINIKAGKNHVSGFPQIAITCDDPSVPCDERNICYKAAKALLCHPRPPLLRRVNSGGDLDRNNDVPAFAGIAVNIHIAKRIPVAAGLGGGSSDAAAVLKGLNELLELNLPRGRLAELGVKLGADVPFFLYDGAAICEGIGERIATLNSLPNMWIILINPNFPVATKWVYEEFDKMADLRLTDKDRNVSHLSRNFKELGELVKVVHNDLEPVTAAKFPEINAIKKLLMNSGALISWMSGSGPTVVGMFASKGARDSAFEKLNRPEWRVIRTANVK